MKHINMQHHFVWEQVKSREVVLKPIPTSHPLADTLIKTLTKNKFNALANKLIKSYWALNKLFVKNVFLLPHIDDIFDQLNEATVFSKIDLDTTYHQILILPSAS